MGVPTSQAQIIVAVVVQEPQLSTRPGRHMALVDALRGCMAGPPPPPPAAGRLSNRAGQQPHRHGRPRVDAASPRLARDIRAATALCDGLTARSHAALRELRGAMERLERASAEVRAIGSAVAMLVRPPELLLATIQARVCDDTMVVSATT